MRIVVAGGTGFIGRALVEDLASAGHEVIVLTRQRPERAASAGGADGAVAGAKGEEAGRGSVEFVQWDPAEDLSGAADGLDELTATVNGADAVVNLAGATLARRWTNASKALIIDSRVDSTRALVEAMEKADEPPAVFVSASAVGYYGPRGDQIISEDSAPGEDFLADVCRRWEAEAERAAGGRGNAGATGAGVHASETGVATRTRVVLARIGLVLGDGGALGMMALPFRLFVGGPLGSGQQWMPWIHLEDAVGMFRLAIEKEVEGPLNVVGPQPLRNKEFAKILGRVLGRPSFMPAPAFAMRTLLGEMADMVLTGQRAMPHAATAAKYKFRFEDVEVALRDVFGR